MFVTRSTATVARKVVSSLTLIGPFRFQGVYRNLKFCFHFLHYTFSTLHFLHSAFLLHSAFSALRAFHRSFENMITI